jgi:hypothetical protein
VCMKWIHENGAGHVCLSAWFNSRTAGQIWMKFFMDIMMSETALKSYFWISYNW